MEHIPSNQLISTPGTTGLAHSGGAELRPSSSCCKFANRLFEAWAAGAGGKLTYGQQLMEKNFSYTGCKFYLLPKSFNHRINITVFIRLRCSQTSLKSRDSSHERCKGTNQNHWKQNLDPICKKSSRFKKMLETIYPNWRFFNLRSFAPICVRFAEICVRFARFKLQEILSYVKKDES